MGRVRKLSASVSGSIALFEQRGRIHGARVFLKELEELERTTGVLRSLLRRGGEE